MRTAIETSGLTKIYKLPRGGGTRTAIGDLSLQATEGQVFAFLGPNGAGKTTTIKMLLGFIRPTSGTASIFGKDISLPEARQSVGYLPEQPYFHKFLCPREALSLHAALLGLPRKERKEQIRRVLAAAGLEEHQRTPISKLSKGLMQRVGIAQALLGNPKLLIMDEPTSGLDPIGRREMKDLIASLRENGRTVFLSSHLLSEVEAVSDRVAILSKGKLVCVGTPDEIKRTGDTVSVSSARMTDAAREELSGVGAEVAQNPEHSVVRAPSGKVFEVIRALEKHDLPLIAVTPEQETLEDAFLRLAA